MAASWSRLGGLLGRHAPRLMCCGLRRPPVELPALHGALRWTRSVPQARTAASAAGEGGGDAAAAAAAAPAGPPSAALSQGNAAPPTASYQQWCSAWRSFLQQLYEQGLYAADPAITPATLTDRGAMKRGVLRLGRERGDILLGLDGGKLEALVKAGFPLDDRKTRTAHKRLQASFVAGQHLPPGDGGAADLQDVLRVFLSLASADEHEASLFRPLLAAATDLLPDIARAAAVPPTPEALAAAAAAAGAVERYLPANLPPCPPSERPKKQREQRASREGAWEGRERGSAAPREREQQRDWREGGGGGQRGWYDGQRSGGGSGGGWRESGPEGGRGRGGRGSSSSWQEGGTEGGRGRGGRRGGYGGRGGGRGRGRGGGYGEQRQQERRSTPRQGGGAVPDWWDEGDK